MRRAVWAAALVLAAGGLSAGQPDAPRKLVNHKPAVGERTRVTKTEVSDLTVEVTVNGAAQTVPVTGKDEQEYTEEVLAVAAGRPTKLTREYKTARSEGREGGAKGYEGKTVLIEKGAGGKFAFSVAGKALDAADAKSLGLEFNGGDRPEDELFPADPVAVGGRWKLPPKVLALFNTPDGPFTIDPAKSAMTGKLTKSYTKAGARYGVVKFDATLVATELSMGAGNKTPLAAGSTVAVDMTVDAVLDGTGPAGTSTGTITFKLTGDTIKLTGTAKQSKTVEPLGKK